MIKGELQSGETFKVSRGTKTSILINDLAVDLDRDDLLSKATLRLGGPGFLLAIDCKYFLLLPADTVLAANIFGRFSHRHVSGWHAFTKSRVGHRIETRHGHSAHRFHTRADIGIARSHLDRACRHVDGLHRGSAESAGFAAPATDIGSPAISPTSRATLNPCPLGESTSHDKVFDLLSIDSRSLDEPAHDMGGQVIGPYFGEGALVREVKRASGRSRR